VNCPDCGGNLFRIRLLFSGLVSCSVDEDGALDVREPVKLGSRMADDAPCRCDQCDWRGTVAEARTGTAGESEADGAEELIGEVETLVKSGRLNGAATATLSRLLEEYRTLQNRVASVLTDSWAGHGD
jgi:hypothetical protein